MAGASEIAAWLIAKRLEIERAMAADLGSAAPKPAEAEALRRFRSYAFTSLRRGTPVPPSLDGLRVDERRVSAVVSAWCEAAAEVAGQHGESVRAALQPLSLSFRNSLRTTNRGLRKRGGGAARAKRRAVRAAIDRICDAYLAVDADSGRIVDANPAAAALLGVARDALIDVEAKSFFPSESRSGWWTQFDAVAEGSEPRRFTASLADKSGFPIAVDCTVTLLATRNRTLALVVARPA